MSPGVLSKYLHSSSIFYPLLLVSCSSVFSPGLHSELSSPSPSAPAPRRHWLSLFELRTASSAAYTRNMKANILSTVLSRFSKITKSVIFIPEISLLASSTIFFCSVRRLKLCCNCCHFVFCGCQSGAHLETSQRMRFSVKSMSSKLHQALFIGGNF